MTTEDDRRRRQLLLLDDTKQMLDTLRRLEEKVDVGSETIRRVKAAVNLAMVAVLGAIFLWYGQARAQSDETALGKCFAVWASLSTKSQEARSDANVIRINFEKTRSDAISHALEDAISGTSVKIVKREIHNADQAYEIAYTNYTDTIKRNPLPESPQFTCEVRPFHLTAFEWLTGAVVLGMFAILFVTRAIRSVARRIKEKRNDGSGRHSHARQQEARQEAGRSVQAQADVRPSPGGRPGSSSGGQQANGYQLPDGQE